MQDWDYQGLELGAGEVARVLTEHRGGKGIALGVGGKEVTLGVRVKGVPLGVGVKEVTLGEGVKDITLGVGGGRGGGGGILLLPPVILVAMAIICRMFPWPGLPISGYLGLGGGPML